MLKRNFAGLISLGIVLLFSACAAAKDTEADMQTDSFYISEITDEIFSRIDGKSFKEECTLSRDDLRYLHVLHKDTEGNTLEGEMIVNRHIAEDVLAILKELYESGYPIEKIRLVDEYDADDELSMEDNNSSCFNFRFISHTGRISKHGLGLAVDLNTLYNPYTKLVDGVRIIEPVTGEPYLDRSAEFDYKIVKGDLCYDLKVTYVTTCSSNTALSGAENGPTVRIISILRYRMKGLPAGILTGSEWFVQNKIRTERFA